MFTWMKDHQVLLWIVSIASIAILLASIFIIPVIIAQIRPDYFAHDQRPAGAASQVSPTLRVLALAGKNLLGALLMIAGVAMLILPGQGLLTMLIGFLLIDFPGKYRLEQWLLSRPMVRRSVNWLRNRAGRPPLEVKRASGL